MNDIITHQTWCQDHTSGECCTRPVDFAPHGSAWLIQLEAGTRLIVDGPPSGLELTLDQASDLSDTIIAFRQVARRPL